MPEETRPIHPMRRPALRSWRARVAGGLAIAVVIVAVLLVVDYLQQSAVTITINEKAYHFRTHAGTVQEALADAGVLLDAEDVIAPPLDATLVEGTTITIRKAAAVAMQTDHSSVRHIRTQAAHPLNILAEQGISVGAYDIVQVNGRDYVREALVTQTWDAPPASIRVVRAVPLTVVDGAQKFIIHTTETDIGRALDAAGFKLYLADRVTPPVTGPVEANAVVTIERAIPITIRADGEQLETRVLGATVADALAHIGLAPVGLDYTIPALDTQLSPNMMIELVRVNEEVVTKDEPIPFETIYQPDATLPLDEKRVIQEGINGVRMRKIRVRYENGKETSRVVQEEWIAQAPTPRMIVLGERVK